TVVTAGLTTSNNTGSISRDDYLKAMYAAGAKGTFGTVAVTRYGQDDNVVPSVSAVRSIMSTNGDASPIQVTETGWATDGPVGTGTVGEQGQAMDIKCSLIKLV